MTSRHRVRRIAKWIGTILAALVLALWLITIPIFAHRMFALSCLDTSGSYQLRWGTLSLNWHESSPIFPIVETNWQAGWLSAAFSATDPSAYGLKRPKAKWTKGNAIVPTMAEIVIPLWLPLIFIAIPSALLWRLDRPLPGFCRECNYNLTGNTSGI